MIHDQAAFNNSIWDWSIFNGCFSATKTALGDLDGIVERHGEFLVIESKSLNSSLCLGQELMFKAMQRLNHFTVIVIWGRRNEPEYFKTFYPNGVITEKESCTLTDLRELVARWYAYVERNKK